jgi:hypothetical protein
LAIITRNDKWHIEQNWENFTLDTPLDGAYQKGVWTDWVLHVKWSPDDSDGFIEAFRDGVSVFTASGKNKYDDGRPVYMKFGIYKWDWQTDPQKSVTDQRVMFYDSLRIADQAGTRAEVDPANAAPQDLILRPQNDVIPWTVHRAPSASEALNKAVTEPTQVGRGSYIWAGGVGRATEVSVGITSSGQGRPATAWFYANTGVDTRLRVDVIWRGAIINSTTVDPGQPFRWRSIPFTLGSAANELRLRFTSVDGGDANVRAAYFNLRS